VPPPKAKQQPAAAATTKQQQPSAVAAAPSKQPPSQPAGAKAAAPGQRQKPGQLQPPLVQAHGSTTAVAAATAPGNLPGTRKPPGSGAKQPRSSLLESGWLPLLQDADRVAAAAAASSWGPAGGSSWKVMDMPRIVRACMQAPPPPPPSATDGGVSGGEGLSALVPSRPQTWLRFRRVTEQSAAALALLEQALGDVQDGTPR
jgi:hypothetical protein